MQKLRRAKWNVIIEQKNWIDKISDIFVWYADGQGQQ